MGSSNAVVELAGITAAALASVRLILGDIQGLGSVPEGFQPVKNNLELLETEFTSLEAISNVQWQSLDEAALLELKAVVMLCTGSCNNFRDFMHHWGQHSLSDNAVSSDLRQTQLRSISELIQHCRITLTFFATSATYLSAIEHGESGGGVKAEISATATSMRKTIEEGDKKLAGVYPALTTIVLARLSDNEDESDRTALINQVATEQGVLQYASKALGLLLVQIQQAVTRFEIMMDE